MPSDENDWDSYYSHIEGRKVRPLLLQVLAAFPEDAAPGTAIDLGCGDGTETAHLLRRGWRVLAVDAEPRAIERLGAKVPPEALQRLRTQVAFFHAVDWIPADLVHASLSLPFCPPERFTAVWEGLTASLKPGGRFAGEFFGVRDGYAGTADMTFLSADQARALFDGFEVESFHELEEDGESTDGPKHWHIITVIARKA